MSAETIATLATATAAVLGAVASLLAYRKSRREKMAMVGESFDALVHSLASTVEVERISGAIRLRRFYDEKTEVGIADRPYWEEAVNVSAAILRSQATGNFQKVLADGLAFAPSLARADLQKTNLQFAYLGSRVVSSDPEIKVRTELVRADFYRADLSRASLKEANAQNAQFYQARLHGTVFIRANLRGANFFEADLSGARFDGAFLEGATFEGARNVPAEITNKLHENVYRDAAPCGPSKRAVRAEELRVFVSKPGCMDYAQEQHVHALSSRFESEGIRPEVLERLDYPQSGALGEVQRVMSGCSGAVIFGFRQLEVREGIWRPTTPEEKVVKDRFLSTPWNQIEAGMAAMLGLPILVISQRGVDDGIFDVEINEPRVYRLFVGEDWNTTANAKTLSDWYADVREPGSVKNVSPPPGR